MITQILKNDSTDLSDAGFMLLEVILSILIIASGLLFIIRSYSTSLKASSIAKDLTRACLFLEEKLFDIDVKGFKDGLKEEESSGAMDEKEGYNWQLQSYPLDGEKELNWVDLKVFGKKRGIKVLTLRKYKAG